MEAYNNVTAAADTLANNLASGDVSLGGLNITVDEIVVETQPTTPREGSDEVITEDAAQETSGTLYSEETQAADAEALAEETTGVTVVTPTQIELMDSISILSATLEEMVPFPLANPLIASLLDDNGYLVDLSLIHISEPTRPY